MKIAFVSADLSLINGQAIVSRGAYNALKHHQLIKFEYKAGLSSFMHVIWLSARYWRYVNNFEILYIVISRSKIGFLRDVIFLFIARLYKKRIIVHLHGNDVENILSGLYGRLARTLLMDAEFLICSKAIGHTLDDHELTDWSYMPNFVSKERFLDDQSESKEKIVILFLSNLIFSKGYFNLFLACKLLKHDFNFDIELRVLGSTPKNRIWKNRKVKNAIDELKKHDWVTLGNTKSIEDFRDAYRGVSIVALPSFYKTEAAPLAIIEGMINRKRILVSDRDIFHELCGQYSAVGFCSEFPADIAAAILEVSKMQPSNLEVERVRTLYSQRNFNENLNSYLER